MKALRKIVKPENHHITIELPEEFSDEEKLEVIIIPFEKGNENKASRKEYYGKYAGKIWISPDFNEPLEDFREYME
ncbi:MAG: DUF2281 domain-containing protein [Spirochaetia bacterium]|nr:DUF2281 domain-containing protein [Spirochaetia bacterium]